eukprot:TRINITY_DN15549_c0_g1_i1.p1 TRINITY_DN15549_c0_g1~~TRINITY_DN15549_c0_g1_i1.p1  ORF type:complete len:511 (+),score=83.59 TRINITY_DN15549_c0_g1_i1:97-1629(+)
MSALFFSFFYLLLSIVNTQNLKVPTEQGIVQGFVNQAGVRGFYGIPYAQPPLGDLRWRPPVEPNKYPSGFFDATNYGYSCYNVKEVGASSNDSEDCLTLNIYAPLTQSEANVPVLVWFHGGGFVLGSSIPYEGSHIVNLANVIVVTLNYRLNVFGFLYQRDLAREIPNVGNLGILDQNMALTWVSRNIAAFGGDNQRITLFGESAGAMSTLIHTVISSPLFNNVICESGGPPMTTIDKALAVGDKVTYVTNCTDSLNVPECLRNIPADKLINLVSIDPSFFLAPKLMSFLPVIDYVVFNADVISSIDTGHFNSSILIGNNRDEGTLFTFIHYGTTNITESQYNESLYFMFEEDLASTIKTFYDTINDKNLTPFQKLALVIGDRFFECPSKIVARASRVFFGTSYYYKFNHPYGILSFLGATHTVELAFAFNNPELFNSNGTFTNQEESLSRSVVKYWTTFASSGKLDDSWPIYDPKTDLNIVLDLSITIEKSDRAKACEFWEEIILGKQK